MEQELWEGTDLRIIFFLKIALPIQSLLWSHQILGLFVSTHSLVTIIFIYLCFWWTLGFSIFNIFHFHALEKEMATHSSVLAWRISGTGEPDGLPSMRLHSRT